MSHKGTILRQLMQDGAFATLAGVAFQMTRSRLCGLRRPVFEFRVPSDASPDVPERPDYLIQRVSSRSELDPAFLSEALSTMEQELVLRLDLLARNGIALWVGWLKGQLANVGLSRSGDCIESWFFPMAPHWIKLSHFLTLPAFRGYGLYPHMMRHIIAELARNGCDRFFVDCADWNLPSLRGIQRAGFKQIGYGLSRRTGQLIWYPQEKEQICGS